MKRFILSSVAAAALVLGIGGEAAAWRRMEFGASLHFGRESANISFGKGFYHSGPGPYGVAPPPPAYVPMHPEIYGSHFPAYPTYQAPAYPTYTTYPHDPHATPYVPPAPPAPALPMPTPSQLLTDAMYWVPAGR